MSTEAGDKPQTQAPQPNAQGRSDIAPQPEGRASAETAPTGQSQPTTDAAPSKPEASAQSSSASPNQAADADTNRGKTGDDSGHEAGAGHEAGGEEGGRRRRRGRRRPSRRRRPRDQETKGEHRGDRGEGDDDAAAKGDSRRGARPRRAAADGASATDGNEAAGRGGGRGESRGGRTRQRRRRRGRGGPPRMGPAGEGAPANADNVIEQISDPHTLVEMGEDARRKRWLQQAVRCFERALEFEEHLVDALSGLGFIYLGLNEYDKALAHFDRALHAVDTAEPVAPAAATEAEAAGSEDEAAGTDATTGVAPEETAAAEANATEPQEAKVDEAKPEEAEEGEAKEDESKEDESKELAAADATETSTTPRSSRGKILYGTAIALIGLDRHEDALERAHELRDSEDGDNQTNGHYLKGQILYEQGDFAAAVAEFETTENYYRERGRRGRRMQDVQFRLSAALRATGQTEQALDALRRILKAYWRRNVADRAGRLCLELGHLQEAEEVFTNMIAKDSRDLRALVGLGQVHLRKLEYQAARSAFERALHVDRYHIPALDGMVEACKSYGDLGRAGQMIDRLRELERLPGA